MERDGKTFDVRGAWRGGSRGFSRQMCARNNGGLCSIPALGELSIAIALASLGSEPVCCVCLARFVYPTTGVTAALRLPTVLAAVAVEQLADRVPVMTCS